VKRTGGFEITPLECFLLYFENADWNIEFLYKRIHVMKMYDPSFRQKGDTRSQKARHWFLPK
jgi:hypothetical protein